MKKILPPLIVILIAILGAGMGCSRKPDDAKISSVIQGKFSQDSGLASKQLTIQSNGGVVTLSGTVDNDAQRDAAAKQAASVAGVKEVVNDIEVASSAPPPAAEPSQTAEEAAPPAKTAEKPKPGKKARHTSQAAKSSEGESASPATTTENLEPPVAEDTQSAEPAPVSVPAPAPPPPPPAPKKITIDQGTQLTVRLVDGINSEKNEAGQTFHATLNTPLAVNGEQVIPAGSDVTGHIAQLQSAGKFAGQSLVVLQLNSITASGQTYNIQTDQYRKEGSSRGKNTAEKVGAGAVVGAVLGGIFGGGKGAAIGSAAGAGVGGGVQAASKSQQIDLPPETVLNFTLQAPVTVVQAPNPNANRPKLSDSQ